MHKDVGLAVDEATHSSNTNSMCSVSKRPSRTGLTSLPTFHTNTFKIMAVLAVLAKECTCSFTTLAVFLLSTWLQARQFRKDHVDSHYGAVVFRYQWEFTVQFRDNSAFVSMDDKHKIKVSANWADMAYFNNQHL